ncbi:MAG: DUF3962 domain-containing protein [Chloroflexota bacterium]
MPRYEQIQTLSFHITPDSPEMAVIYDRIALPDTYKRELLDEYRRSRPKARSLPIDDLNRLVRLLVPDLYSIDSYAGRPNNNWLRAEKGSVGIEGIRILLDEWSNIHGMGAAALPDATSFQWEQTTTILSDWRQLPNGTAQAVDSATYDILPALLAREIEGQPFDLGGANTLTFYRVSKSPDGKGHELMSWPPLVHKDKDGDDWYYSYYLQIVIATVPFNAKPFVHVYLGIRRWVSAYHKYLPNEQLSIYLRAGVSYIKGVKSTHTFQVAPAALMKPEFILNWGDKLPIILKNVGFPHDIPGPEMLRQSPTVTLKSAIMPNMALVYNTRMGSPDHGAKPGVSPYERAKLLEILSDKWRNWLEVAPSLTRAKVKSSLNQRAFSNTSVSDTNKLIAQRWARLRQQHRGSTIRIEIYYQRPESRAAMLDTLGKLMGIDPKEGEYERDFVKLTIAAYELGDLGAALKRSQNDTMTQVMEDRRDKLLAKFGSAPATTVALIEIGNERQFEDAVFKKGKKTLRKPTDPKQTLRAAFAHTGRLSQFFTVLTESEKARYLKGPDATKITNKSKRKRSHLPERFTNAVLDGLRQLGIHQGGQALAGGRWKLNNQGYAVAGFWLIQQSRWSSQSNQQRFLPTLVYIDGETGKVLAWVAGMSEMLPYHEVLLRVGRGEIDIHHTQETVAKHLPHDLEDRLSDQNVVLAVDVSQSGMRNRVWNWLQDSKIEADKIVFNDNRSWVPEDKPRLRVVRVRSAEEEVPTWYAVPEKGGEDSPGISKGLWKVSKRVFGSTVGTPGTQKYSRNITKTNTNHADVNTPNPGFYELTAAFLQKGDDPAEIVSMIDQLRGASAQSKDETAHTLPLHLAERIEQYLLWVEELEISEEETDTD